MTPEVFAPPLPHDPVVEVFPNLWFVRGILSVAPGFTITRTMTVVREDGDLTVFNAIRPEAETQALLEGLGTVRHVVKLGHHHGRDDAWYVAHYGATQWGLPEHVHADGRPSDRVLAPGSLPVSDAELFVFDEAVRAGRPEAAMVLERHGGVLVTCDAVQNFTSLAHCSWAASVVLRTMGFVQPGAVGPLWRRAVDTGSGALADDLQRLLQLRFRHLLPGHGLPLLDTAHDDVATAVQELYR